MNGIKFKKKYFLNFLIIFFLIINIFFNLVYSNSNWFNNNYQYKKEILINTTQNITSNNFQINLILNSSNVGNYFNWSNTCNDITFTNLSNSELPFWVEYCNSSSKNASIWIKIYSNISTIPKIINFYYGDLNLISKSNGNNTFDFFDDFNTNLNKWNKHKRGQNILIQNGILNITNGITSSPYGHSVIGSDISYNNFSNGIIEGKVYLSPNSISEISFRGNYSSNAGYKARIDSRIGEGISFLKPPYFDGTWGFLSGCSAIGSVSSNLWHNFKISVFNSIFNLNLDTTFSNTCSDSTFNNPGEISFQNHYGPFSSYDDIRVRKYFPYSILKYFSNYIQTVFPNISFINPTPLNNSIINDSIFTINVSISNPFNNSAYIDFNHSLIGYWNFENISGTTIYDSSTHNNNGNLINGVKANNNSISIRGNFGNFSGISNDNIDLGNNSLFNLKNNFTLEAYIYTLGSGSGSLGEGIILNKEDTYEIGRLGDGTLRWAFRNTNPGWTWHNTNFNLTLNKWHHITITYDKNYKINTYVNGNLVDSYQGAGNLVINSNKLKIGDRSSISMNFDGYIDEVKIWNRVLSLNEIKSSFNSKINPLNLNFSNLQNGNYSFYACGIGNGGNPNCTKNRFISVNLSPFKISYVNPILNSGIYNTSNSILVNTSTFPTTEHSTYIDFNKKLLGYWNFENPNGNIVPDLSTYKNNGTLYNGILINTINKIRGKHLDIDGHNDYMKVSNLNVNISNSAKTTVEFWMYWKGVNNEMPIGWQGQQYDLWIRSGCFGFNTGQGNIFGISSTGLVNSWHHIVTTFYNGVPDSINNEIWIDGIKKSIYACLGTTSRSKKVSSNLIISGWSTSGYKFRGYLDEVKVWNGNLSKKEIQADYNTNSNYFQNYSNLNNGNYSYYACSNNLNGNFNCTNITNIKINYSLTGPKLKYELPTPNDNSYLSKNSIIINISINSSNLDTVILNWNGTNESLNCSGISPYYYCNISKNNLLVGNNYTFSVSANDTNSIYRSLQTRTIFIIESPKIILNPPSPLNNSNILTNYILLNISINSTQNLSSFIDFDRNLLGYWNFENSNGNTVPDLSSYKNNGTLYNGILINNINKIRGKYLDIDGNDDYMKVSNLNVNISNGAKTTVEFWMYWKGGSSQMPFGWQSSNYDLYFSGGCFGFNTGENNVFGISSAGLSNSWHHIVTTFYNGVPDSINNEIWVDGVKKNIYACSGTTSLSKKVSSNLIISGWSSNGYKFGGYLDEVKIWKGNLSADLINYSYNSQKNNFIHNFTNLNYSKFHSYNVCSINLNGAYSCSGLINFTITEKKYLHKNLEISKNIKNINFNQYLVSIQIKNKINKQTNLTLIDFVDNKFTFGSFNIIYNWTNISNGNYNGKILGWNLSLNPYENLTINYSITKIINNFNLKNEYLIGGE